MKIKLTNVRLAFPALFEAKSMPGAKPSDKPKFGATLLLTADDPQLKTINTAIETVAKDKWGAKAGDILKGLRMVDKVCLHNGDTKAQYDGFPGNMFISAGNPVRPTVVGQDRAPLTAQDGKVYAGCYVVGVIEVWAQDNNFGKRVNATLLGVQFYKDGDSFAGGGSASADDFDDISAGAEAADFM